MGAFTVGDVVILSFPYADFTKVKKRPALVVGLAEFDNLILCQITSRAQTSKTVVLITAQDFTNGSLRIDSFVRPDKLFTIEASAVQGVVGAIDNSKLSDIKATIRQLFE